MARWTAPALLVLAACMLAPNAFAIGGRVVSDADGSPLPGVAIDVEALGAVRDDVARTAADGRFEIDLVRHFTDDLRDTYAIYLSFRRDGYLPYTGKVETQRRGDFSHVRDQAFRLSPLGGAGQLSDAERQALEAVRRGGRRTFYLLPYRLDPGNGAGFDFDRFAGALRRSIVPHLQALPVPRPPQDVAVRPLDLVAMHLSENAQDFERLRAYGHYLNGLAMISGEVFLPTGTTTGDPAELSSQFQIVPQIPQYGPGTIFLDDRIPATRISSARLSERLSPLWRIAAVLAVAVQEFNAEMDRGGNLDELRRIREYLVAQRSEAGPEEQLMVRRINALVSRIDTELAR